MQVISAAPPHLVSLGHLRPEEFEQLLMLAADIKADPESHHATLRGRSVLLHFAQPSTRTRVSMHAAAGLLGATSIVTAPSDLQLGHGEPIRDTARVVSRYCAAIVIRTPCHRDVEEFAAFATVPVINALSDSHHPCQALADALTLKERFGSLAGLELAYVGDANNVAHSLIQACALAGIHLRIATPAAYRPRADVVSWARALLLETGGSIELTDDPAIAVTGCDAVYTDVFVSMGEEPERERKLHVLGRYRVDQTLLGLAAPGAVFMHCLPAHRDEEVTDEVIEGEQSVVFDQAENRLWTAASVLASFAGR